MITLKKLNPLVESHTAKQSEVIWFVSWLILLFTGGCSIKPLDSFEQILIHETKSVLFMFLTLAYFFKDFLTNPNKKKQFSLLSQNHLTDPTPTLPWSTTEATRPWTTSTCSNGKKGPVGCNCYAAETAGDTTSIIPMFQGNGVEKTHPWPDHCYMNVRRSW